MIGQRVDRSDALQNSETTPIVRTRKWCGTNAKLMICVGPKTALREVGRSRQSSSSMFRRLLPVTQKRRHICLNNVERYE